MTKAADQVRVDLVATGVRWRQDVPTAERRDTVTLRGVKILRAGRAWYWLYTRLQGWQLQGSHPQPPAIDR